MMTFDPAQNRVPTCLLTADELAALKAACGKHGRERLYGVDGTFTKDVAGEWYPHNIYRAKPAPAPTLSITVNGVTNVVAAGVMERLAHKQAYWLASTHRENWTLPTYWMSDDSDAIRLSRGLIYLTEAAARAHAMAMVGLKVEAV